MRSNILIVLLVFAIIAISVLSLNNYVYEKQLQTNKQITAYEKELVRTHLENIIKEMQKNGME